MKIPAVVLMISGLLACGSGNVSVMLTDAPIDDAEKVEVAISEVSVHFVPQGQDGQFQASDEEETVTDPETPGWHAVMSEETTFDLLELKDNPTLLGIADLDEGKVTQIRLWISETTPSTITMSGVDEPLSVISYKIKLTSEFDIVAGEETEITLDFDAAESVKLDGTTYKLHPTIKVIE